jgi:hypothetical protein
VLTLVDSARSLTRRANQLIDFREAASPRDPTLQDVVSKIITFRFFGKNMIVSALPASFQEGRTRRHERWALVVMDASGIN